MGIALAGVEPILEQFSKLHPTEQTRERREALARFEKRGFPTLKNEAWRYTNVSGIQNGSFELAAANSDVSVGDFPAWADYVLVYINGVFSNEHSNLKGLPAGAGMNVGFASTYNVDGPAIESPFVDLNEAMSNEGYKLNIDAGTDLKGVILVRFIGNGDDAAYHTRSHIIAGAGSNATVVEEFVGEGAYFSNTSTMVDVHEGAVLTHIRIQTDDKAASNIGNTVVKVRDKARYNNFAFNMGAKLARNEIRGQVDGHESDLHLIGANLVADATDGSGQHLDTTTFIDHSHADTTSNELYKSVLRGSANAVFQGKIEVQEDSQRIVGNQMSRALMLSPKAQINTKPELEIYADDVICSHGATIGDLDEEALFYLRSRGISADSAQSLLVSAFIEEVLDEVENEDIRATLSDLAAGWMKG